ncbi:MAG: hypothetical protein ACERKD_20580 [Prolixibacteraceae bacterium]
MKFLAPFLVLLILVACNKDDTTDFYSISGFAQKGPFINGSNVVVYEFDNMYKQTGKSFVSTTESTGGFELENIPLSSPYIGITADGFYFNENSGELSTERLSLKAIADISNETSLNVNILTHLEYERVRFLIANEKYTINEAKQKAQQEILTIFNMDDSNLDNAEKLDIRNSREGDSKLLAISLILQGNNSTSELSKLLADFVSDIKEDGILNDTLIQSNIVGQAQSLNCDKIRQNLVEKYSELGLEFSTNNDFESAINLFIENTNFSSSSPFRFPKSAIYGINFLDPATLLLKTHTDYSFAAEMPGSGELKIQMTIIEGSGVWYYQPSKKIGWNVSTFTGTSQIFTSIINGQLIDLPIQFDGYGKATVDYYYNNSPDVSFTKTITWGVENNSNFVFPDDSPNGISLLNIADNSEIKSDTTYVVALRKSDIWEINFTLSYSSNIDIEVPGGWGKFSYSSDNGKIDFTLTGKDGGDDISEIQFKVSGSGEIKLESNDLEISSGKFLNRTFFVKE